MIATCAVDRSIRLWTYHDKQFNIKMCQTLNEEPLALSMHPSGFHMVVSTADSVKIINILDDRLEIYKELGIKGCKVLEFSNGGQYFAC